MAMMSEWPGCSDTGHAPIGHVATKTSKDTPWLSCWQQPGAYVAKDSRRWKISAAVCICVSPKGYQSVTNLRLTQQFLQLYQEHQKPHSSQSCYLRKCIQSRQGALQKNMPRVTRLNNDGNFGNITLCHGLTSRQVKKAN